MSQHAPGGGAKLDEFEHDRRQPQPLNGSNERNATAARRNRLVSMFCSFLGWAVRGVAGIR